MVDLLALTDLHYLRHALALVRLEVVYLALIVLIFLLVYILIVLFSRHGRLAKLVLV